MEWTKSYMIPLNVTYSLLTIFSHLLPRHRTSDVQHWPAPESEQASLALVLIPLNEGTEWK